MTWKKEEQSTDVIDHIVDLRLRAERMKIAETALKTSSFLKLAGFNTDEFDRLVKQLAPQGKPRREVDLVSFTKRGVWRKKYLSVVYKPGSVF